MKTIFASKTFWVQVLALAMLLFPPVKAWLESNPVQYLAALSALNVLVRFFTSGAATILPGAGFLPDSESGGRLPAWLLLAGLGGAFGGALPACSPGGVPPVQACYIDAAGNKICYSTVDGITATVDRRSGK